MKRFRLLILATVVGFFALSLGLGLFLAFSGGNAEAEESSALPRAPIPSGFDGYMVFMSNGTYDPKDPNCETLDGEIFDRAVMGRDDAAVAARKADAVEYFLEEFGIDFSESDVTPGGEIELIHNMVTPCLDYRAYTIGGASVGPRGWPVFDAFFGLKVVGEGAELCGKYGVGGEGGCKPVPIDSAAVYGEYLIKAPVGGSIPLFYASGYIPPEAARMGVVKCMVFSPIFGVGIAIGLKTVKGLPDGRIRSSSRTVVTFPY